VGRQKRRRGRSRAQPGAESAGRSTAQNVNAGMLFIRQKRLPAPGRVAEQSARSRGSEEQTERPSDRNSQRPPQPACPACREGGHAAPPVPSAQCCKQVLSKGRKETAETRRWKRTTTNERSPRPALPSTHAAAEVPQAPGCGRSAHALKALICAHVQGRQVGKGLQAEVSRALYAYTWGRFVLTEIPYLPRQKAPAVYRNPLIRRGAVAAAGRAPVPPNAHARQPRQVGECS